MMKPPALAVLTVAGPMLAQAQVSTDRHVACTPSQFIDLWRQSQAK